MPSLRSQNSGHGQYGSGSVLSREDRQELVRLLCDLDEIRLDPSRRQTFVAIAGLGDLSLDYTGTGRVFAIRLVEAVEKVGIIQSGVETYSALGALLDYILGLDYVRADHKLFLASLVERYNLFTTAERPTLPQHTERTSESNNLYVNGGNVMSRWFSSLWRTYLLVFLIPLISFVAAVEQLWELDQCSSFRFAMLSSLLGGAGMLAYSWLPWNRHQYEAWDRPVTVLLTVICTGLFTVFAFSSCGSTPPESYQYLISVYDVESKVALDDALVAIIVGGQNISGRTGQGSNGIAVLLIPNSFRRQQAQLVVSKGGYKTYRDNAHYLIADSYQVPLTQSESSDYEESLGLS